MLKTNRSTLHTVYNIQQSATQGSNDTTHRLSHRTACSNNQVQPRGYRLPETNGAKVLPTIRSGGPSPRKHLPDGATKASLTDAAESYYTIYT